MFLALMCFTTILVAAIAGWLAYKATPTPEDPSNDVSIINGGVGAAIGFFGALGLMVLLGEFIKLSTMHQWFSDLGFESVFEAQFKLQVAMAVVGGVLAGVLSLYHLRALMYGDRYAAQQRFKSFWIPVVNYGLWFIVTTFVIWMAVDAWGSNWQILQKSLNAEDFGRTDPIFGRDYSFYVFTLPMLEFLLNQATHALLYLAAGLVLIDTAKNMVVAEVAPEDEVTKNRYRSFRRGMVICAGFAALTAVKFHLASYQMLISDENLISGIGNTDYYVRIPMNEGIRNLLIIGVLVLLTAGWRGWKITLAVATIVTFFVSLAVGTGILSSLVSVTVGALIWFSFVLMLDQILGESNNSSGSFSLRRWAVRAVVPTALILSIVTPPSYQYFVVSANESTHESRFIEYEIEGTHYGYNLSYEISDVSISAAPEEGTIVYRPFLSPAEYQLPANLATLENTRTHDWRILLESMVKQLKSAPGFGFFDVDLVPGKDENGNQTIYMLSLRQRDPKEIRENSRTWQNLHLNYTHGYCYVVTDTNSVSPNDGAPVYLVDETQDCQNMDTMPPAFRTAQPRIYFGEGDQDYVILNTKVDEITLLSLSEQEKYRFEGDAGILLDSGWDRFQWAVRLNDYRILTSGAITSESQLVFMANIEERLETILPDDFRLASDMYPVITQEGIYWIVDVYSTAQIPYSTYQDREGGKYNYIRPVAKAVVNAYDGSVNIYLTQEDAITRTWSKIMPGLFTDSQSMPAFVLENQRYPEDYFDAQANAMMRHHITDPESFYQEIDLWRRSEEKKALKGTITTEARYILMQLPGEDQVEPVLIQPFSPATEKNDQNQLTAWMAGVIRDGQLDLIVIDFPDEKRIIGPLDAESKIQTSDLSNLFTLQGTSGSQIILGNIMTLPLFGADNTMTLIYVKPIYISDEDSQDGIPRLKYVVLVSGTPVSGSASMIVASSLNQGLQHLFSRGIQSDAFLIDTTSDGSLPTQPQPPNQAVPTVAPDGVIDPAQLPAEALRYWQEAEACLRQESGPDWVCFDQATQKLENALLQMQ